MITRCVRPAERLMTRHARASSLSLSALSGPRTRDSVSWRHRASPLDKEVLRFFLPPQPELTFVLFSTLGRSGPAACPLSTCTTAIHAVYRPAALATGHLVFCASSFGLPGVSSTQQGGEKDSTLPSTAPAPARGSAGPAPHRSHSPLQASPEDSQST